MNFEPTDLETDYEFVHFMDDFVEPGAADYPNWIQSFGKGITYAILTKQILDLDCKYCNYCLVEKYFIIYKGAACFTKQFKIVHCICTWGSLLLLSSKRTPE